MGVPQAIVFVLCIHHIITSTIAKNAPSLFCSVSPIVSEYGEGGGTKEKRGMYWWERRYRVN